MIAFIILQFYNGAYKRLGIDAKAEDPNNQIVISSIHTKDDESSNPMSIDGV